jgi:hypothetical protein
MKLVFERGIYDEISGLNFLRKISINCKILTFDKHWKLCLIIEPMLFLVNFHFFISIFLIWLAKLDDSAIFFRYFLKTSFYSQIYLLNEPIMYLAELKFEISFGTFHVKKPKVVTFFRHGSENLNQIFLTDSPINLKYRFILAKLTKMKTRIFAAYWNFQVSHKTTFWKTRKCLHLYAATFLYATKLQLNMLFYSKIFRCIVLN